MPYARRQHSNYGYTSRRDRSGITSTYFVINWATNEYIECRSEDHACSIAFGRNKRYKTMENLACIRTADYFKCL